MVNDLPPIDEGIEHTLDPDPFTDSQEIQTPETELTEVTDQALDNAFGIEEEALIDGIDHEVKVSGFSDSEVWNDQEVATFTKDNVPPEHLADLNSITYMEDQIAESQGILGQWTETDEGDNYIIVYPQADADQMQRTIAHEIGHNAQDATIGWDTELAHKWEQMHKESDDYVSWYAGIDPPEDFAECYSAYINDPELLQKVSPEKYDFIKEHVFSGS